MAFKEKIDQFLNGARDLGNRATNTLNDVVQDPLKYTPVGIIRDAPQTLDNFRNALPTPQIGGLYNVPQALENFRNALPTPKVGGLYYKALQALEVPQNAIQNYKPISLPKPVNFNTNTGNSALDIAATVGNFAGNLPSMIGEGLINTPGYSMQSAGRIGEGLASGAYRRGEYTNQNLIGDIAGAAEFPLMVATFGRSPKILNNVFNPAGKSVGKKILGSAIKSGIESIPFGITGGLKGNRDAATFQDQLTGTAVNTAVTAGAAAILGGGITAGAEGTKYLAKGVKQSLKNIKADPNFGERGSLKIGKFGDMSPDSAGIPNNYVNSSEIDDLVNLAKDSDNYDDFIHNKLNDGRLLDSNVAENLKVHKLSLKQIFDMAKNEADDQIPPNPLAAGTRPQHQVDIEAALKAKDFTAARSIVDSLDDADPYKASMKQMLSIMDPNGEVSVGNVLKDQKGGIDINAKIGDSADDGRTVYHGGDKGFIAKLKKGEDFIPDAERDAGTGGNRYGLSTSTKRSVAQDFSGSSTGNPDVIQLKIKPDAKIYDLKSKAIDDLSDQEIRRLATKYDIIRDVDNIGGEHEVRILNPKALITSKPKIEGIPGKKLRGFPETVSTTPGTPDELAKGVLDDASNYYNILKNKDVVAKATQLIASSEDDALKLARNGTTTDANATAMLLIDKYIKSEQIGKAQQLIAEVSPRFTKQGQQIQILSLYGRLTPTGAIKYAQGIIDQANSRLPEGRKLVLTKEAIENIARLSEPLQNMPDGRAKTVATAELMKEIASQVPSNIGKKIAAVQTIAQLLNPKTAIRNLGGNAMFNVGENLTDAIATPIDAAVSLVTGKRTKVLPNLKVQAQGFLKGGSEGIDDAMRGIDTSGIDTQFDLPKTSTFADVKIPLVGDALRGAEKLLNIELRAPDRAFYKAAYEGSLNNQMRAAGVKEATQEMIEQAHLDGLYRTFQDETVTTKLFTSLKKALNLGRDFGLGDILLKYPKTPASLIQKGLDYSPVGFAKTVYEMGKPLMGNKFNQKAFVEAFSRALVGTSGLITTGAILNKLGVITGKPETDRDISAVQRSQGEGAYRINVSALKRFLLSGMNAEEAKPREGDMLINYDWIQPFAIPLSMGANIAENGLDPKKAGATIASSIEGGVDTIAEQPLVKGLTSALRSGSPGKIITDVVKNTPSSFVPGIINQINQLLDNTPRNATDPNPLQEGLNLAQAKIPGLAQKLPISYGIDGKPRERYQDGSNNAVNVFLNPAFISTLKNDPAAQEVLRIFEQSGETQQAPRLVQRSVEINGEQKKLTGEEQSQYQKYVGEKTKEIFDQLVNDPSFQSLTDEEKAKEMASILTDINTAAKVELFGHNPSKMSKGARLLLANGSYPTGAQGIEGDFKLTGTKTIDDALIARRSSDITKAINEIVDQVQAGSLDPIVGGKQIDELKAQQKLLKDSLKKPSKGKKIAAGSLKFTSASKGFKSITYKKPNTKGVDLKALKLKIPKLESKLKPLSFKGKPLSLKKASL